MANNNAQAILTESFPLLNKSNLEQGAKHCNHMLSRRQLRKYQLSSRALFCVLDETDV